MNLKKISAVLALGVMLAVPAMAEEKKPPAEIVSIKKGIMCMTNKDVFLKGVAENLVLLDSGSSTSFDGAVMVFRHKKHPKNIYIYDVFTVDDVFYACEAGRFISLNPPTATAPETETDKEE